MTFLENVLFDPTTRILGWTLLHFLWQGALVAVAVAGIYALLGSRPAAVRYLVACGGLLLMLVLPAGTAWWLLATSDEGAVEAVAAGGSGRTDVVPSGAPARPAVLLAPVTDVASRATAWIEPFLPALVAVWFLGILMLSLRLVGGWTRMQWMKTAGTEAAPEAERMLVRLARRLGVRRQVRVLASTVARVPLLLGWLRPVILLPVGALRALSPRQIENVIAHELAHVRRHDYLVNVLQSAVEILLFYHPAVWWLSGRIRAERENCCDDLAVAVCGDTLTYVQALTRLEELRAPAPALAVAATGPSLLDRVRRLLGMAPVDAGAARGPLAGGALVTALVLAACLTVGARAEARPAAAGDEAAAEDAGSQEPTLARPYSYEEEQRVAATCEDWEKVRRCVDPAGELQLECAPRGPFSRFWAALRGKDRTEDDEVREPTVVRDKRVAAEERSPGAEGKRKVDRKVKTSKDLPACRRDG